MCTYVCYVLVIVNIICGFILLVDYVIVVV